MICVVKSKVCLNTLYVCKKLFFAIVLFLTFQSFDANAQITIDNSKTINQLVTDLMGTGVSFSNEQFQGVRNVSGRYQIGAFTTATTTQAQMGFNAGVVLSTGNTSDIPLGLGINPGTVAQMSYGYTSCTAGEVRQGGSCPTYINDLDILAGSVNYYNAAILEFDFVPIGDSINFRYVFGSEEYSDQGGSINYQCSSFNDKFGFLISGPGISGGAGYTNDARNIARLANGSEVGINSVNSGVVGSSGGAPNAANCLACNSDWVQNSPTAEYYGHIDGTELNGNTKALIAAQGGLTPGQTYHIKLLILDANDAAYDAVVYIEAGSFTSPTAQLTTTAGSSTICSGSSTTLTTTVNYGTPNFTYTWGDGTSTISTTTNTSSTSDQITVSPTTTTTYYVTVVDNNVPTPTTTTSSVTVNVTPLPTANISYSASSFCNTISAAQSINLTGTNAYTGGTYSALPAGLTINGTGSITPSTSTPGNYTVTYTIPASGGCSIVNVSTDVEITSPVSQTISGVSQLCSGLTNTFTVSPTAGGTWTSSATGIATIDPNTGLVTGVSAGSSTITYSVTTTGGCINTATQNITVNSLPNVTASSNVNSDEVCDGGSVILTGGGALIYQWSGGITNNVSFVPISTTTYTVTGTDVNLCENTDQITITVNSLPDIDVSGLNLANPTACLATDGSITGIVVTGAPVIEYVWNGGSVQASSDISGLGAGSYTLVVTDGNNCVSSVGPYSLSDPGAPPAPTIDPLAGPVCEGSPIVININNPDGGATYTWTGPSGALGTGTSITIANAALSDAGSYSAQTTIAGCTGSSSSVSVSVTPMPTADISYNDPYCSSNSTLQQVNQTGTGGGSFSSDISGIDLNSSNGEINPSLSNPGSYVITYTIAASGGCPDVMAIDTVDISALPSATVSYPNSPFCSDLTSVQNAEIIGSSGGTYSASSGLTIDSNTGEFTPSSNMPGSYTITYTIPAANGCPVVTANTIIDITQLPAASISYGQPFCISEVNAQNVSLTGNTGGSFYADVAGLEIDSITGDIIPGLSSAGSYTVTYMIDSMNGCAAVYSTTSVTINEMPTAAISYSGSPFCTNNSTPQSVNISGSTGGYFTSTAGLQIDSLTGAINPSLCSEGTYIVAYTIPAAGGCAEVVVNTNVTIVKSIVPVTAFTYSSPVCINGTNPSPQLDAGFYTGGNFSATSGITVNTTNGEVVLSSSSPGTYVVTYSTLASGCTLAGTSTADITIEPSIIPVTDFSYSIPSCMDGSTPVPTLTNGFTTGGFYSVVPAGLVIDSVTGEIILESSLSGSYTITYETTEIGCRLAGSSSSVVVVSNEGCLNIATAFSPNKDGANDTWEIEHIEMYDEVTLQVFNRWGQLMFEYSGSGLGYSNPDAQWDGTFNGKELPVSSFVFIVDLHNDQKPIQGIVTIIR